MRLDLYDICTLAGLALTCAGLWLIYRPLMLIVLGVVLFWAGTRGRVK